MRTLLTFALAVFTLQVSFGWGPKGHAVIADIAANHISKKTAKKVDAVLGGETMVDVSSWPDMVRKDPKYAHTATWHFLNVDEGYTYETMPKDPKGDVYTQLNYVIDELKGGKLSPEDEKVYLTLLIHLVGDMHCPLHTGHRSDLGGNMVPMKWFGQPTNLHSIWDSKLVESCRPWSYSEWTENIDRNLTRKQIKEIADQPMMAWVEQSLALSDAIYKDTPANGDYSYDYYFKYTDTVKKQFLDAGLRLARLLDEIYGK